MGIPGLIYHLATSKTLKSEADAKRSRSRHKYEPKRSRQCAGVDISNWVYDCIGSRKASKVDNEDLSGVFRKEFWSDIANAVIGTLTNDPKLSLYVEYFVAPYEADAQLAYLANMSPPKIDIVITRDADLIAYGCEKIFFNLDFKTWEYYEYNKVDLQERLQGLDESHILQTLLFVGCDYIEKGAYSTHIFQPKERLNKIAGHMKEHRTYDEVKLELLKDGILSKPLMAEFDNQFRRAELIFKHQLVFDAEKIDLVHLTPLNRDDDSKKHLVSLGALYTDEGKRRISLIDNGDAYTNPPHSYVTATKELVERFRQI